MKKGLIGITVAVVLLVIFFAVDGDRWIKNSIGDSLGYGTCPNCGDNWWWKNFGSIEYGDIKVLQERKDYALTESVGLQIIEVTRGPAGVMVCKECLAHPERLDEERIAQHLLNSGWSQEKVEAVKLAVIRYKNERLNNK